MGFFLVSPCAAQAPKLVRLVWKAPKKVVVKPTRFSVPLPRSYSGWPKVPSSSTLLSSSYIERACAATVPFQSALSDAMWKSGVFPGKKDIDAVIFDLDGTLLDSLSAWEHSGSNFVRSQGFEPPAELDDELVAMSLMDGANLIKSRYQLPYNPEEILEMTLRPIKEHYYRDIIPMPGIPQTLARLQAQGVKMAVATASDRELAVASLHRLGLLKYLDFVITCDEVGVGKSSPKVYEEALKRLGTAKERTLVAEDALHALQTAHQAGFPTAAIEEQHSASQRTQKQQSATYYVFSYHGQNVFKQYST